ncbi:LysM peptidoglycan-binding domain-containing protein [uncultured Lutibacter sp.]|uniref:muramidase family protein n=1 Tax=uncultured Lutibacter sp. TaxID=437739 RepID=UPI0026362732|nr:LysM peptidoglycan-binding domain-containing protein [uncultured Lutibacter sp.]
MKKLKLITFLFLLFSIITIAQQKKYVSYTVKKGETIKSIAKRYDLSTRDLLRLNPDESRRPKPGTVIVVPNLNYGKTIITEAESSKKEERFYTVQPKETVFGISKKFGITIEELKAANFGLIGGLKIGMRLRIPESKKSEPLDLSNYVIHTVVKDDTFFKLTRLYEVTEAQLKQLNPELKDGLKLGMVLKIKPLSVENIKVENDAGYFVENIDISKKLNVAVMLPYQINKYTDSTRIQNFKKNNSLLTIVSDVHLGVQMAIDSLKHKGLTIQVNYYDTENSNYKLQYLVNKNDFSNVDVILGPLFFEKAHWLAKHVNAPVVAPVFSKNQTSLSAGNLIKSAPNTELLDEKLMDYLKDQYKGEDIIIINDGKAETQTKLWRTVNKFKTFDSIQNITVIKPEKGYIDSEKVGEKLNEKSINWVVLISDDTVITSSAINSLKTYIEAFNIKFIAFNKGDNFDSIDNNLLGRLNFLFPSMEYLDMDATAKNFYKSYKSKYFAYPSKYATRGFDVTYDILIRLASEGSLEEGLKAGKSQRVSSVFNYDKKLFGSFENHAVYLIQYTKELLPIIIK